MSSAVDQPHVVRPTQLFKWREPDATGAGGPTSARDKALGVKAPTGASSVEEVRESIDKVLSAQTENRFAMGEARSPDADPNARMGFLEDGVTLHRKNEALGITTRGTWLDWEAHKHLYLPPPAPSGEQAEFIQGSLFQKKQGKASGWKQREFRADLVPGTISYTSKESNARVMLWIVSGCIVQRLDGKYDGRMGCLRVLWPSGYDLILSTIDVEPSCSRWYSFLCAMLSPPADFLTRRLALSHGLAAALQRSAIRSQKREEPTPYGNPCHTRQLAKLSLRVAASYSDTFAALQEPVMFRSLYALSTDTERQRSAEWVSWATMGRPRSQYTELPELHFATCPATTEISAAWERLVADFPDRHWEELRRFLVNAKHDATAASEALRRHIQWRAACLPLRPHSFAHELDKGECFVHGIDHSGCPVIYYFVEKQSAAALAASSRNASGSAQGLESQVKACLYRLEQAIARLPSRDGKVSVLVCFPLGAQDSYFRNTALALALARVVADNYPERLNALLLYPRKSASLVDLAREGLSQLPTEITRRIVAVPDEATLRSLVPKFCTPARVGGDDQYSFSSDVAAAGSSVLMPPLWAGMPGDSALDAFNGVGGVDLLSDYYPPPAAEAKEWLTDGYVEPEAEPVFCCDFCKQRVAGDIGLSAAPGSESECAVCRFANRQDEYYGGWKPVNSRDFPEPSAEAFRRLAREQERAAAGLTQL